MTKTCPIFLKCHSCWWIQHIRGKVKHWFSCTTNEAHVFQTIPALRWKAMLHDFDENNMFTICFQLLKRDRKLNTLNKNQTCLHVGGHVWSPLIPRGQGMMTCVAVHQTNCQTFYKLWALNTKSILHRASNFCLVKIESNISETRLFASAVLASC